MRGATRTRLAAGGAALMTMVGLVGSRSRRPGGGQGAGDRPQDRQGERRLQGRGVDDGDDPHQRPRRSHDAQAHLARHRDRQRRRSLAHRVPVAGRRQGDAHVDLDASPERRRPVAVPAGGQSRQAHQLEQQVRLVHGQRVRVRRPRQPGGRQVQVQVPGRRADRGPADVEGRTHPRRRAQRLQPADLLDGPGVHEPGARSSTTTARASCSRPRRSPATPSSASGGVPARS